MGLILLFAIGLIIIFGILLHLILRYIFKINVVRVLIAATISSIIILLVVVFIHQSYNLSNIELLILIFPLAIISSFIIAWAEQKYLTIEKISSKPEEKPATTTEAEPIPSNEEIVAPAEEVKVAPEPAQELETQPVATAPETKPTPETEEVVSPPEEKEVVRDLVQEEKKEVFADEYRGKPEEALDVLIEDAYKHLNSGAIDSAIQSFRLAIVFAEDPPVVIPLRIELGRLWFMTEEPQKAKEELKKAYDLAKQIGDDEKINEIGTLLDSISEEG